MVDEADDRKPEPHDRSRRELLKRIGMVGAASVVPGGAFVQTTPSFAAEARAAAAPPQREALETLTAAESDTLEAIVARLIPSDENGPGAAEARAAHYIDRALAGPLASARKAYAAGLAALNTYAQTTKGEPFARLQAKDQDAVLSEMEKNAATGFTPNSSTFFNLLRAHTIQGTFCDPYYGGNANFVGWDLIRYPGVRISVTAQEQRMGVAVKPNHKSAYDESMFTKRGGGHGH
jgi:gluconate 2-dehydrogenase gamma chain